MKTKLQTHLATIAPQIEISTHWVPDTLHPTEILKTDPTANPSDWQAWQTEIKVRAVSGGKLHTASAYLCGTWCPRKEKPWNSIPDVLGHELRMTAEALRDMFDALPETAVLLGDQIAAAFEAIRNFNH